MVQGDGASTPHDPVLQQSHQCAVLHAIRANDNICEQFIRYQRKFAEPDNESLLNFWVHLYYSCSKEPTVQDPEDQNPKAGLLTRLD